MRIEVIGKVPSVNHYWVAYGKKRFISDAGVRFKSLVRAKAIEAGFKPLLGDVAVSVVWHRGDKRRADLDNILKVVLDSLSGLAYLDDSQVTFLEATKRYSGIHSIEISVRDANDD